MKTKFLFAVLTLFATTSGFAGGLSDYNVEKNMNADRWETAYSASKPEITVQGPLDRFEPRVYEQELVVDTNQFKKNFEARS